MLAANGVDVMLATGDEYTPTPAVSHAILAHNRGRDGHGLADGIVVTPSHNPPEDGGCKHNPPNGGPADIGITARMRPRRPTASKPGCARFLKEAQAIVDKAIASP